MTAGHERDGTFRWVLAAPWPRSDAHFPSRTHMLHLRVASDKYGFSHIGAYAHQRSVIHVDEYRAARVCGEITIRTAGPCCAQVHAFAVPIVPEWTYVWITISADSSQSRNPSAGQKFVYLRRAHGNFRMP